jgi:undecaprenyl-diphosphatase
MCNSCYGLNCNPYCPERPLLGSGPAAHVAAVIGRPHLNATGTAQILLHILSNFYTNGIHGQVLFGSVLSGVGAYVSVRFLTRYFQTRTLTPFGIYCLIAGLGSLAYLQLVR